MREGTDDLAGGRSRPPPSPAALTRRILIVDDEYAMAEVVGQMLSDRGLEVDLALNGEIALARMAARPPDLVLLDVAMPVLDGPGLLRRMRTEPALADVPVILMTSLPSSIPEDVDRSHQGVLVKPFTPEALFDLIDSTLRVG